MKVLGLVILGVAGLVGSAAQAQTINYASNGSTVGNWGPASGQAYGEEFTALGGTLNDFSLTVSSSASFNFVAQVYAFSGASLSGPALYTSNLQTIASSSLTTFTFNPNIGLTQAGKYIAFVTNDPTGTSLGGSGSGYMQQGSGGPGAFYFWNYGGGLTSFGIDAAFRADFGPAATVPEPGSLALMGAGLVGLAVYRMRRHA